MDRPCQNCHQYFDIREHNGKCSNCKFDNFNQSTCSNNVSNKPKKINMKNFKDNQKVRHPKYGEGVINIDRFENIYVVTFNEVNRVTSPIGDDFYSQLEPVEDLPNVGEYAYFWYDNWDFANYAKFETKSNEGYYISRNGISYKNISKTPPF
jgi:hypothetical protein